MVVNAQMAFWRVEALKQFLSVDWNAWEFEEYGSEISIWSKFDFYTLKEGVKLPIPYDWRADGYSVVARKWTPKCQELFKREQIKIDFSKRGILDPNKPHYMIKKQSTIKRYLRYPFFRRCLLRLLGICWKFK